MKKISLTQGKYALIDDDDFELISSGCKWQAVKSGRNFYAIKSEQLGHWRENKKETIRMHRLILDCKEGEIVDHLNGNGLDNRKSNLRKVTHEQNQYNRKRNYNNKTGYKGVCAEKNGSFRACIAHQGKRHFLGMYKTAEDAALAYNIKAKDFYGEYANLNRLKTRKKTPEKYKGTWNKLKKQIKCLTNNKIYSSFTEAATNLGLNRASISNAVIRGNKLHGHKFEYVTKEK